MTDQHQGETEQGIGGDLSPPDIFFDRFIFNKDLVSLFSFFTLYSKLPFSFVSDLMKIIDH